MDDDFKVIELDENSPRSCRVTDVSAFVSLNDTTPKLSTSVVFEPSGEFWDFHTLEEQFGSPQNNGVSLDVCGLMEQTFLSVLGSRLSSYPEAAYALKEIKVYQATEVFGLLSVDPRYMNDNRSAVAVQVNGAKYVVAYPENSNLGKVSATIMDSGLLNCINAAMHGIVEGVRDRARHNVLAHSKKVLELLDDITPHPNALVDADLAKIKSELADLREQIKLSQTPTRKEVDGWLSRMREFGMRLSMGVVQGIGKKIGENNFYPLVQPHIDKAVNWLVNWVGTL